MADLVAIRTALLSVSDKSGLIDLARALAAHGTTIISTGGTAKALADAGIQTTPIERVTGLAEMLDGRVKTLHPAIHAGLLARRDDPAHQAVMAAHGFAPIDLVCVNLYPFERTIATPGTTRDQAIEQIDIGGPAMIRSAAKNHSHVAVVTDPDQYADLIAQLDTNDGALPLSLRQDLAVRAFARTSAYDRAIADELARDPDAPRDTAADLPDPEIDELFPPVLTRSWTRVAPLRYGENPHQQAALYRDPAGGGSDAGTIVGARQLHGKPLSYNNLADAAAALDLVSSLVAIDPDRACACVVKHANPCGGAIAPTVRAAIDAAIAGDPLAAFGGIVACSQPLDHAAAVRLAEPDRFFEVIAAPSFKPDALALLAARWKMVRLLEVGPIMPGAGGATQLRTIPGGLLAQQRDLRAPDPASWTHAAGPKPTDADLHAAAGLEQIARALSSNAIALGVATDDSVMLVGAGAGQMDRLAACRLAVAKAGDRTPGAIAASDAFFPFSDGPAVLIDAGVRMILQPGGSRRDSETIDLCDARSVTLMMTGVRRFRH